MSGANIPKQIRPEYKEAERILVLTGNMREDLVNHFRIYCGGPMDAFIIDHIMWMVESGFAKKDERNFKFFMKVLGDCSLTPKQMQLIRKKLSTVEPYDPQKMEKNRLELISGNGEDIEL